MLHIDTKLFQNGQTQIVDNQRTDATKLYAYSIICGDGEGNKNVWLKRVLRWYKMIFLAYQTGFSGIFTGARMSHLTAPDIRWLWCFEWCFVILPLSCKFICYFKNSAVITININSCNMQKSKHIQASDKDWEIWLVGNCLGGNKTLPV